MRALQARWVEKLRQTSHAPCSISRTWPHCMYDPGADKRPPRRRYDSGDKSDRSTARATIRHFDLRPHRAKRAPRTSAQCSATRGLVVGENTPWHRGSTCATFLIAAQRGVDRPRQHAASRRHTVVTGTTGKSADSANPPATCGSIQAHESQHSKANTL